MQHILDQKFRFISTACKPDKGKMKLYTVLFKILDHTDAAFKKHMLRLVSN